MSDLSPPQGFTQARTITTSDTVVNVPAQALAVMCTVAGNIKVQLLNAATITVPVAVGLVILPLAAVSVFTTGTTATATYSLLN